MKQKGRIFKKYNNVKNNISKEEKKSYSDTFSFCIPLVKLREKREKKGNEQNIGRKILGIYVRMLAGCNYLCRIIYFLFFIFPEQWKISYY